MINAQSEQQSGSKSEKDELVTLRRTNAELLQKSTTRKAKIAELESAITVLQTDLSEAKASIYRMTVETPLMALAEDISSAPEALMEAMLKEYRVESRDGELRLLGQSGDEITHEGKPVHVEPTSVRALLLSTKDPARLKLYKSILIASKASGGMGGVQTQNQPRRGPGVTRRGDFGLR